MDRANTITRIEMTKTKDRDKIQVRINYGKDQNPPIDIDEIFLNRDDPSDPSLYVNETKYVTAGDHSYKEGEFTEATVEKKIESEG